MKRFFLVILLLLATAITAIFIYRFQIIRYSAEALIRRVLPPYIRIDKINFDAANNKLILEDFKILNPDDFSYRYLLEIGKITCRYRLKGHSPLDGFEILEPSFERGVLNIERLADGRINLNAMKGLIESDSKAAQARAPEETRHPGSAKALSPGARIVGDKTLPDILKLPENFSVKDSKAIFIDRLTLSKPHMITLEKIDARLSVRLNSSYSAVTGVACVGQGRLNGNPQEIVKWDVSMNPTTPRLTMSNRLELQDLDILSFEPYYDKQSPFIFKRGRFSGTMVFDFDNGNIGSTNEVRLRDYLFYIKRGYENAEFWQTTVQDLAAYFTSPSGEIIFDFKIKGDMEHPKFYLGPISKQAIASMAIGKISDVIRGQVQPGQADAPGAPKSDIEKAQEYIELFKGLIKKK